MPVQDYKPTPGRRTYYVSPANSLCFMDGGIDSFCCGYGKMDEDTSIKQILDGIEEYREYKPRIVSRDIIIHEPNLRDQPKYYQKAVGSLQQIVVNRRPVDFRIRSSSRLSPKISFVANPPLYHA